MSPASSAFLFRYGADRLHEAAARADIARAVDNAFARARQAWPRLLVAPTVFGAALAERMEHGVDPAVRIAELETSELYFALACVAGEGDPDVAIRELERRYIPQVRAALARLGFSASTVDETLSTLRATLLLAGDHGAPRLLEYGARGQLAAWLRVVASRIAYRAQRPQRRVESLSTALTEQGGAGRSLEIDYLKRTYGPVFEEALREALAGLPVADRVLLKERYAHKSGVVDLGARNHVHASTITRRVQDARAFVAVKTRAIMAQRLRVHGRELSSILRLMYSQAEITLSTQRGTEPRGVI